VDYQVVFDARSSLPDLAFAPMGFFFAAVFGGIAYSAIRALSKGAPWGRAWFMVVVGALALIDGIFMTLATVTEWHLHREALASGECTVVEGTVENFVPEPPGGHGNESFEVQGRRFEYSGFASRSGAFHQGSGSGGPVRAGSRVRIHSDRDAIVRLEIASEDLGDYHGSSSPLSSMPFFLIPLAFLVLFPVVAIFISAIGGWSDLAATYGTAEIEGESFVFQSVALSLFGNYNHCIVVGVGNAGFTMRPTFPFSFGHARVSIPWSEVKTCTERRLFFRKWTDVTTRESKRRISIDGKAGRAIQTAFAEYSKTDRFGERLVGGRFADANAAHSSR